MEIADRIILVTGGGSGLGAGTAHYLSEKGAKIVIADLDEGAANHIASKINGLAIRCNVTDSNDAENLFKRITSELGAPEVCINCAGIAPAKRIVGRNGPMPLEDFEKVLAVNLIGTFNIMRLAAFYMSQGKPIGKDNERGLIINTASIAAFDGQVGQSAYSASKAGICGLTLPAARDLADFNIRVVTIAPGIMQTPLMESMPEEVKERLAQTVLSPKRLGQPREYAMLAAHIIENSYINGEVIRLDAGLRMQPK